MAFLRRRNTGLGPAFLFPGIHLVLITASPGFTRWPAGMQPARDPYGVEYFEMSVVAFVGLGAMGLPMAKNLLAKGFEVRGADLHALALDDLVEAGGIRAGSVAEAAHTADEHRRRSGGDREGQDWER